MANTASGWPYVVPADHPLEYPVVSEALANKLEASISGADTWQPWTAVPTNFTIRSQGCTYQKTPGGLVTLQALIEIQTMGAGPRISLPPGVSVGTLIQPIPFAITDYGTAYYPGIAIATGGSIVLYAAPAAGGAVRDITAAVPFTWAATDQLHLAGTIRTV